MKHKVSELEGALLDAAVALCEGWTAARINEHLAVARPPASTGAKYGYAFEWPQWSSDWTLAGSIIQRERIMISPIREPVPAEPPVGWCAMHAIAKRYISGPTALIAAMRAYVASKFGEEVELP